MGYVSSFFAASGGGFFLLPHYVCSFSRLRRGFLPSSFFAPPPPYIVGSLPAVSRPRCTRAGDPKLLLRREIDPYGCTFRSICASVGRPSYYQCRKLAPQHIILPATIPTPPPLVTRARDTSRRSPRIPCETAAAAAAAPLVLATTKLPPHVGRVSSLPSLTPTRVPP
jgi:hypothetical protein